MRFVLFFVCVYLRLRISSHPRPIAGVPFDSVRRFRATLLLHTTCMRLWGNWVRSCVVASQTKNQKPLTLCHSLSLTLILMMMIAFITIKSSLVPLIEGLCTQIYFRFEISVVCSHILLFFFVKEKMCWTKKKGS